tara:strand:- start:127 stop:858 length:732 start_codon:yes stop_codon:yes gene_type:complete
MEWRDACRFSRKLYSGPRFVPRYGTDQYTYAKWLHGHPVCSLDRSGDLYELRRGHKAVLLEQDALGLVQYGGGILSYASKGANLVKKGVSGAKYAVTFESKLLKNAINVAKLATDPQMRKCMNMFIGTINRLAVKAQLTGLKVVLKSCVNDWQGPAFCVALATLLLAAVETGGLTAEAIVPFCEAHADKCAQIGQDGLSQLTKLVLREMKNNVSLHMCVKKLVSQFIETTKAGIEDLKPPLDK